jgi:tetratricopeptide (TPR) repeat protein
MVLLRRVSMRPWIVPMMLAGLTLTAGWVVSHALGEAPAGKAAPADTAPGKTAENSGVADAKRSAALQLFRQGKLAETVTILKEVVAGDPSQYRDHLQLARCYDKLGQAQDAAEEYHRVLELTSDKPKEGEERQAKGEAERRIKVLDALSAKVDATVDRFLKELEGLEKEAESGKNEVEAQRLMRLMGGVYHAEHRKDRALCEVQANLEWQDSGLVVEKGRTYSVRTTGQWCMTPGVVMPCSAAGAPEKRATAPCPSANSGSLIGSIDRGGPFAVGETKAFTASASGRLYLQANDAGVADNSGTITVQLERQ